MRKIYWKAGDFEYMEKSIDWYWVFGSIAGLLIFLFWYIFEDTILASLVLISAVMIIFASFKKPVIRKYSLDDKYIYLDDKKKKIELLNIESYNIDYDELKILINTKDTYKPLFQIPFEHSQDVSKIENFLKKIVKKDEKIKIPIFELIINRLIGF